MLISLPPAPLTLSGEKKERKKKTPADSQIRSFPRAQHISARGHVMWNTPGSVLDVGSQWRPFHRGARTTGQPHGRGPAKAAKRTECRSPVGCQQVHFAACPSVRFTETERHRKPYNGAGGPVALAGGLLGGTFSDVRAYRRVRRSP